MLSDHYGSPSRDIMVLGEQRSKKEGMNSSSCQFASCTSTLGKSLTRESWKKLIRPLITVSQGFVNTRIRRVAAYYCHPSFYRAKKQRSCFFFPLGIYRPFVGRMQALAWNRSSASPSHPELVPEHLFWMEKYLLGMFFSVRVLFLKWYLEFGVKKLLALFRGYLAALFLTQCGDFLSSGMWRAFSFVKVGMQHGFWLLYFFAAMPVELLFFFHPYLLQKKKKKKTKMIRLT